VAMADALDLLSSLVLPDGHRWAEVAETFQWQDARTVLDPDSATPYSFLTRARGGSKTTDLAGMALAVMLAQLPSASRLYGLAADRDQGRLLVDAIAGYAQRTPELRGAIRVEQYRVHAPRFRSVLEVLAADAPSAWGLLPDFVVVDEIGQWGTTGSPRRIWEAVSSSVAKKRGARLCVLTTSGDPAHWSRKVLDHALADPLWYVHEVPGPPPWMDEERLAEQRRRLPESSYRRLFMNEWMATDDALASPDEIAACVLLDGPVPQQRGRRYVVGLDLGLKRDRSVACVCHAEPVERLPWGETRPLTVGARVVLDRIEVWEGSRRNPVRLADVETWVAEASIAYNRAQVVFDPWQAHGTMQRLAARGIRTIEFAFTAQSVGRLASTLLLLLRNGALALPDDEALLDELANIRVRESAPGALRLDHDADKFSDRVIALSLAAQTLIARPQSGMARVEVAGERPFAPLHAADRALGLPPLTRAMGF
jgi:phage terminase large subunit-like protein